MADLGQRLGGQTQQQAVMTESQKIIDALGGAQAQISNLTNRLELLADRVVGTRPKDVGNSGQAIPTATCFTHNINGTISDINEGIARAFEQLGRLETFA